MDVCTLSLPAASVKVYVTFILFIFIVMEPTTTTAEPTPPPVTTTGPSCSGCELESGE